MTLERPRVLVVSHEASRTGAPRVAGDLLRALRGTGAETVIWHRWGGPLLGELDALADTSLAQPLNGLRARARRWRWARPAAARLDRWGIERVLDRVRPDAVWCNTVVTTPVAVAAAGRGIPVVIHSHEQATWIDGPARALRTAGLAGITLVGCSSDAAELLARAAGAAPDAAEVLHTAVDVGALRRLGEAGRPAPAHPTVLGCGTADPRKGFDVFVAAARRSAAAGDALRWRWVGAVPDGVDAGPVEVTGELASATGEIARTDVFALPSRADSFPLVVLEAMALARPVVASALLGPTEQLGETGVLVPPGDGAALANAVRTLVADPERARSLGSAGAERCAERWDRTVFDRRVGEILDQAIIGHRHSPTSGDRPLRILHLMIRLSRGGGVQVVVRRLAEAVDPAALDLHVVTVRPKRPIDETDDVAVTLHPLGYQGRGYRPRDRARLALAVAGVARALRPDVVQLHSGLAWLGSLARVVAPRTPFVLEVHDAPGSGRHGRVTDRVEGWWVRRLGATAVCHSSSVAGEVRARWKPPPQRLVVFPLGVDVDRFHPATPGERARQRASDGLPPDLPLAVGVGRLAASKCFHHAVEAVARCRDAGTDVGLVLVGDGPEEARIRAAVARHGVEDRVWLTGHHATLPAILGAADVALSASSYEGFGLTVIEAMACGLPVVARAVGGVTDLVVDGETGRLVRSQNVADLANALQEVVAGPERCRAWGTAGRDRAVEHFSTRATARSFTELYRRLAPLPHSTPPPRR